jgi:hypothetical protein
MAKKARRRTTTEAKPAAKKPAPKKPGRRAGAAKLPSPGRKAAAEAPAPSKVANWLPDKLTEIVRVTTDYRTDFVKSRKKDRRNARLRAGIAKKLDGYVERVDLLRRALRTMPDDVAAYIRDHAPGRSVDMIWTIQEEIVACLDRMYDVLVQQQTKIARPMTEEEEREFWAAISRLAEAMTNLGALAEALLTQISASASGHDTDQIESLTFACRRLSAAIGGFGRDYARHSRTGTTPNTAIIQAAAEEYRLELGKVSERLEEEFPNIHEVLRLPGEDRDPIAAEAAEILNVIGFQQLQIDAARQIDALRFDLPGEADNNATELRRILDPILRENRTLAAMIESRLANVSESIDLVPETSLPDYNKLSTTPREQDQLRIILDCLLSEHAANGPNSTMTRKDLVAAASRLADLRSVDGMGETNVWNKLSKLVDLKIVHRTDPVKSRSNPNASSNYRLTIPAQNRYSEHVDDVAAELSRMPTLDSESLGD